MSSETTNALDPRNARFVEAAVIEEAGLTGARRRDIEAMLASKALQRPDGASHDRRHSSPRGV